MIDSFKLGEKNIIFHPMIVEENTYHAEQINVMNALIYIYKNPVKLKQIGIIPEQNLEKKFMLKYELLLRGFTRTVL